MKSLETLAHCWLEMKNRPSDSVAIRVRRSSGWKDISWQTYYKDIERAAAGLNQIGVKKSDRVAIISNTRYEWGCADFAIFAIGATTVPIYPNSTPEDVEYMLNESNSTTLIVEGRQALRLWRTLRSRCTKISNVVCFETDDPHDPLLTTWDSLLVQGKGELEAQPNLVVDIAKTVRSKDIATILFTSGTTGQPKGVLLAHEQGISEVSEAFPYVGVEPTDVSLCFLPFSHILGRIELWGHAWTGFTLAYAESIEKVRANLQEIRPTILVSVPRIFEKIHSAILSQIESHPIKKNLFKWALMIGKKVNLLRDTKQLIPLHLLAQHEIATKTVLGKINQAFGGRLRFAISGGAPINHEISEFFHACGILILEGYGLSETTAAITVNAPFDYHFGSVGKPIGDTQIRIAEDGEILIKGKKVMQGYDNNPEATAKALKDGWFHTGDIGEFLPSGDLKITDRKKDLIKTAGGKYVAPQKIEGLLQIHPFISHVVVHGDNRKFIVALVAPDRMALESEARSRGLSFRHWTDLIDDPQIQKSIREAVAVANSQLATWESVKKYAILRQEFTVEAGELTPSLKVKRKAMEKKFADVLESLYR